LVRGRHSSLSPDVLPDCKTIVRGDGDHPGIPILVPVRAPKKTPPARGRAL